VSFSKSNSSGGDTALINESPDCATTILKSFGVNGVAPSQNGPFIGPGLVTSCSSVSGVTKFCES